MNRTAPDVRSGIAVSLRVVLIVLLCVIPGRWALAGRRGHFIAGLCSDMVVLLVPIFLVATAAIIARPRWRRLLPIVGIALAITLWSTMITLTESTLSRGVFPSWVDAAVMARSPSMMEGSLHMFLLPRNLWPTLLALPVVIAAVWRWPSRPKDVRRAVGAVAATLAMVGLGLGLGAGPHRSPLSLLGPQEWNEAWTCLTGPCEPREALAVVGGAAGEHLLGWPKPRPGVHPYRRRWPAAESDHRRAPAHDLLAAADALGAALFEGRHKPTEVWQIALEGFRGDDLHALHDAAPREVAPFINTLYEASHDPEKGTMVSRRMWTAGLRTPHGVSALLCGLGTLPFGLALPRDLHGVSLRCLPDILGEAGYDLGYAYGGAPEFDRLDQFFAIHGMNARMDAGALASAPRTTWGATDRYVFDAATRVQTDGWSYHFVLSLSHHHPYGDIPDLPPEVAARAASVMRHAADADDMDRRRLTALVYTDDAVRRLFERLATRRALVVLTADHPIPERQLWTPRLPNHVAAARIPFVMWMSPRLLAEAQDRWDVTRATKAFNAKLQQDALSQNDVPTILLAILAHTAPLRSLSGVQRWHTMGGQTTSPFFRTPTTDGRVMGINAATTFYSVGADDQLVAPVEPARLVVTQQAARQVTPSLLPAVGALRRLLAKE